LTFEWLVLAPPAAVANDQDDRDHHSPLVRRQYASLPKGLEMIILGLILLIVGYLVGLSLLYYLGGILLVVGVVFLILGSAGRPIGGRKVWF
jgi:hypothetical protein